MDKKLIKTFAIEARVKLRESVMSKLAKLGITDEQISEITEIGNDTIEIKDNHERFTGNDVKNRAKLVEELNKREQQTGNRQIAYDTLVEEVAYTWFNRLIAIRFMEVNDYLPERERVLSSESGIKQPDIITHLLDTEMYAEFDLSTKERVTELLSDSSADAVDELYQLVFIKQCNSLNQQLPDLFEKIDDYTELLFTISYIDDNGVIASLLNIPEDAFNVDEGGQVEIIGWMYQYYNTEPKDKVFARGSRKIRADEIPAATQLFTPDWIVRYMVENSLGRYYIDQKMANPNETRTEKEIANEFNWQYYLQTAEQPEDVQLQIQDERKAKSDFALQELKLIDPSMGSGHILVYAFDVFMQLYEAEGESPRTASELILENNLFGLDIDQRAFQLAYFALMMKGRQYSRRILSKQLRPNVYVVPNNSEIGEAELQLVQMQFNDQKKAQQDLLTLVEGFKNGAELGSLIQFEGLDFENLKSGLNNINISFFDQSIKEMILVGELLQQQYEIGITNPPYMGSSGFNKELYEFSKNNYPDSKRDLSTMFMERISEMITQAGYYTLLNIPVWMFISSYEKLRKRILHNRTVINMSHNGRGVFGSDFGSTAFVIKKSQNNNYIGEYLRLFDNTGEVRSVNTKKNYFLNKKNQYFISQNKFNAIPGHPISYWVSESFVNSFSYPLLSKSLITREGMATADNERFLRYWSEINFSKIGLYLEDYSDDFKWYPYNKGGAYRKWDSREELVVNWSSNGFDIKNNKDPRTGRVRSHNYNGEYALKSGLTWSSLTSGAFSARFSPVGYMFDSKGAMGFKKDKLEIYTVLGLLNSVVAAAYLKFFSPTLDYKVGDIILIPNLNIENSASIVIPLVKNSIDIVHLYYQCFESNWDFNKHPLI
ncbi:BREX-1 system adenine-specific DNA-methyltransferase PglX [Latilactobacillus curvatus]|uniref:BREX-1 system adenine-specific DNA-methyltransferase PglX n=1 Tax=Latilactobacillus curvatus TaxID=28038 RepID=UPI001CBBB666|nr:BREX-1 system adenine-specific DNA-methyltransferase PglX [Latilactobacillus curvatus]MBZ1504461.1 BREX-1 system adenine-specific DNA-methyltransferase PglX [Latilactobacillus curvatus]